MCENQEEKNSHSNENISMSVVANLGPWAHLRSKSSRADHAAARGEAKQTPARLPLLPLPSRLRTAVARSVGCCWCRGDQPTANPAPSSPKTTRNRPRRGGQPRCRAAADVSPLPAQGRPGSVPAPLTEQNSQVPRSHEKARKKKCQTHRLDPSTSDVCLVNWRRRTPWSARL